MDWKKRIYCGELDLSHIGTDVHIMGWVDAIRDHGHVIFIHLRDLSGIVQIVFDNEKNGDIYSLASTLKEEYVLEITGKVENRLSGTENPNLKTGSIEIYASQLEILSRSKTLPFQISEKAIVFGEEIAANPEKVDEELRLQYRYLDLRRPSIQNNFIKRYNIIKCIRECLDQQRFIELETPVLTKSTPEGARDYLVPSRVHPGTFYALPQSPQIFKQIFMISGMDRYFQIVKCFRDEDLRPNRQPEFTQLDLEASFIDEEFIYELIEELVAKIFVFGGITLQKPFPRITYDNAMDKYGCDRPDLRFGMAFEDVTDIVKNTGYSIFRQIIASNGIVKGFCVKGQADVLSKNVLQNEYAMKIAPSFGAKGMTWMKVAGGKLESNIVQFFTQVEQNDIIRRFKAEDGDVLMMVADSSAELVSKVLCSLRLHVAERLNIIPDNLFCPVWVTDFPLFEYKSGKLGSTHHPFTMPDRTDFNPVDLDDLLSLKSRAYDLVVNGEELGGGSIRIHRMDIQEKIFHALGLDNNEVEAKFGFFLRALEFGAPPHGGLALGLDRVVAMILKANSIRDVIAFPKNRSAYCPLSQAPSHVDASQLVELGLDRMSNAGHDKSNSGPSSRQSKEPDIHKEKISSAQVKHVAKLARLSLNDSEASMFKKDLNSILGYVEMLEKLDTKHVEPMRHVLQNKNVWRDDVAKDSGMSDAVLSNAPMREENYYKVPKILEG